MAHIDKHDIDKLILVVAGSSPKTAEIIEFSCHLSKPITSD